MAPASQKPEQSCTDCLNVIPTDSLGAKDRGGVRPGISKFLADQINGSNPIQGIGTIVSTPQREPIDPEGALVTTTTIGKLLLMFDAGLTGEEWSYNNGFAGGAVLDHLGAHYAFGSLGGIYRNTSPLSDTTWVYIGTPKDLSGAGGSSPAFFTPLLEPTRQYMILPGRSGYGPVVSNMWCIQIDPTAVDYNDVIVNNDVWKIDFGGGEPICVTTLNVDGNIWAAGWTTKITGLINIEDGSTITSILPVATRTPKSIAVKRLDGTDYVLVGATPATGVYGDTSGSDRNLWCLTYRAGDSAPVLLWAKMVTSGVDDATNVVTCVRWHEDGDILVLTTWHNTVNKSFWKLDKDDQSEIWSVDLGAGGDNVYGNNGFDGWYQIENPNEWSFFVCTDLNGSSKSIHRVDESAAGTAAAVGDSADAGAARSVLTSTGVPPPETSRQSALVTVSAGSIYTVRDGTKSQPSGGDAAFTVGDLNNNVMMQAAYGAVYIVDGTVYRRYFMSFDPDDDTVLPWITNSGVLPTSCNIITLYRGRVVLAGDPESPHNWYMSAQTDPLDWDYSPTPDVVTKAVAGNNSEAGEIGDVVRCLIPISDDNMIMGGDRSLWVMRGDPADGGVIDRVADGIGISGRFAGTLSPTGVAYFFGNRKLWQYVIGSPPTPLSEPIDDFLDDLNLETYEIILIWDTDLDGLHVILRPDGTPDSGSEPVHLFWRETGSFWKIQYPAGIGPSCASIYDFDDPDDRTLLLGGWDGYIRHYDTAVDTDDGEPINSLLRFAPQYFSPFLRSILMQGRIALVSGSGAATLSLYAADTVEAVVAASTPKATKALIAGTNTTILRQGGNAIQIALSGTSRWAYDDAEFVFRHAGKNR